MHFEQYLPDPRFSLFKFALSLASDYFGFSCPVAVFELFAAPAKTIIISPYV
jgi:hypothetical protein